MERIQLLRNWVEEQKALAEKNGEKFFLGIPDSWYEPPHYADINGHISNRYLKSEQLGCLCLSCFEPLFIIPAITESELKKILKIEL